MSNASSGAPAATIRPQEAAHFGQLASEWWDPKGSSAMLHKLNPVRLGFIRDAIDAHWPGDSGSVRVLSGKRALDVGCGAGLLCEPLARLGAAVTGIDAAPENIAAASALEHEDERRRQGYQHAIRMDQLATEATTAQAGAEQYIKPTLPRAKGDRADYDDNAKRYGGDTGQGDAGDRYEWPLMGAGLSQCLNQAIGIEPVTQG